MGVTDATITVFCKRDVRKKYHHSILSCVGIMDFCEPSGSSFAFSSYQVRAFLREKFSSSKKRLLLPSLRQIGSWHHISCLLITIQWMIVEDWTKRLVKIWCICISDNDTHVHFSLSICTVPMLIRQLYSQLILSLLLRTQHWRLLFYYHFTYRNQLLLS